MSKETFLYGLEKADPYLIICKDCLDRQTGTRVIGKPASCRHGFSSVSRLFWICASDARQLCLHDLCNSLEINL